jgi:hypothetical protein
MDKDMKRFMDKVSINEDTDCWIWTAYCNKDGYGNFWYNKKYLRAHRFSYEYFREPIPNGLQIDHLCRVRNCVNPYHLEPVTTQENTKRGESGKWQREKTHCKQGHEYNEENIIWLNDKNGEKRYRGCRLCRQKSVRKHDLIRRGEMDRVRDLEFGIWHDTKNNKTHCKRGHEFNKENTVWMSKGKGQPKKIRGCKICRKEYSKNYELTRDRKKIKHDKT